MAEGDLVKYPFILEEEGETIAKKWKELFPAAAELTADNFTKGRKEMIVNEILEELDSLKPYQIQETLVSHTTLMVLHTKALACHCECLGMNAENCAAVSAGGIPPYNDKHYFEVMEKWELVDKDGKPII